MSRRTLDQVFPAEDEGAHWAEATKTKEERALKRAVEAPLGPRERARWVPAARCRECGVITWKISLSFGRKRSGHAHAEGCSEPPGKFDRYDR